MPTGAEGVLLALAPLTLAALWAWGEELMAARGLPTIAEVKEDQGGQRE